MSWRPKTQHVTLLWLLIFSLVASLPVIFFYDASAATAASTSPTTSPSVTDIEDPVSVELQSLSPSVLTLTDTVTLTVKITNTSAQDLTSARVRLSLSRVSYSTRYSLTTWEAAPASSPLGSTIQQIDLPEPLAAKASTTATFQVAATDFKFTGGTQNWGAKGIAISVDGDGPERLSDAPLGVLRTYLLWYPQSQAEAKIGFAFLMPLTATSYDPLDDQTQAVNTETKNDGRLNQLLTIAQVNPKVSLAVDPNLLARNPDATWKDELEALGGDQDIYALPAFDQDQTAYLDAGLPIPEQLVDLPANWKTSLYLGDDEQSSEQDLLVTQHTGKSVISLAPGVFAPKAELTYTTNAKASIIGPEEQQVTALVQDQTVHDIMFSAARNRSNALISDQLANRQRLLAELAVIYRERPAEQRIVYSQMPRDFANLGAVKDYLQALNTAPWVELKTVSELADSEPSTVERTALDQMPSSSPVISASALQSAKETLNTAEHFATILTEPNLVIPPLQAAYQNLTSRSWLHNAKGLTQAQNQLEQNVTELLGSITVIGGSNYNLISSGSEIPMRLKNSLNQAVSFQVNLVPDDTRLRADVSQVVRAEKNSEVTTPIKLHAVGSGDVTVGVELIANDGTVIELDYTFSVRVRADWETLGTAIIAGILVLLLSGGIWRTIKRGRAKSRVVVEGNL